MKKHEPNINVTDETRLIVQAYMDRQAAKRLAKYARYGKEPKKVRVRVVKEKPVKLVHPYQKHIDKLKEIEQLLKDHKTFNDQEIVTDKEDEKRVLSAARYVETAVSLLLTLKKMLKQ